MKDTEFLCEKRLAKLNPGYNKIVQNVTVVLFNALEKYKLFFPDYTDHTVLHSLHVMEFCNKIIGEYAEQLNEDELFILIMAAYLHDCGMGISEANYRQLYDKVVSPEYRKTHPHDNTKETIRSFHHSFSKQMIYRYADLFDIPSKQHVEAIAIVSESHRKTDLFNESYIPAEFEMPNGNRVHLPYLASLIRLADELDIASDRNLEIGDQGQPTIFKLMHHAIRCMTITDDRFILDIDTDDPALFDDIVKETSKLKDTLNYCVSVVEKRTPFRITQTKIEFQRINSHKKKAVVLDTDLGTDDACALLLMNSLPVKPDFVVASYGNTTLKAATRNAIMFRKYLGADYKVVRGLSVTENSTDDRAFHGPDGLGGISGEMADKLGVTSEEFNSYETFEDFEKTLLSYDSVTYITIGTLTNLARLLSNPEMLTRFSGIYVMGGGLEVFNRENNTEFNFSRDPSSVKALLSAGINVTLFPLDVTTTQRLYSSDIDELEKSGKYPEFISLLRHNLSANLKFNGNPFSVLHDTLPVLYLSHPEAFRLEDMRLVSDEFGHIEVSGDGEALHVCTSLEDGYVKAKLKELFAK